MKTYLVSYYLVKDRVDMTAIVKANSIIECKAILFSHYVTSGLDILINTISNPVLELPLNSK